MYSAIFALFIALTMIFLVISKGQCSEEQSIFCTKEELSSLLETLSDDCIIQIWIGRNSYEYERAGNT